MNIPQNGANRRKNVFVQFSLGKTENLFNFIIMMTDA